MSNETLYALQSPTTQAYQNLTNMFRDLIRNRTNSSFDFLPLIFTTYVLFESKDFLIRVFRFRRQTAAGNIYQITADISYRGNISDVDISNTIKPILSNLPPQFGAIYSERGLLEPSELTPLNRKKSISLISIVFDLF